MFTIELYGCHFEYDGISSRTYGLIFANGTTERFTNLSGASKPQTMFDKKQSSTHIVDIDYSDSAISFDAEIICEHEVGLEKNVRRQVERWLFERPQYKQLYIDMTDDFFADTYELINGETKRLYFNCRFVNPEKLEYNGGVVGYKFTIECDSRLAWQEPIIKTFSLNHNSETQSSQIVVSVDTDLNDYTYPIVAFYMGDIGGTVHIINNTDDPYRQTEFIGINNHQSLVMKNDVNYISQGCYANMSKRNFIRLLNGDNIFTIKGNVKTINFEWQNRRFI